MCIPFPNFRASKIDQFYVLVKERCVTDFKAPKLGEGLASQSGLYESIGPIAAFSLSYFEFVIARHNHNFRASKSTNRIIYALHNCRATDFEPSNIVYGLVRTLIFCREFNYCHIH